jgi:hypothetical protein
MTPANSVAISDLSDRQRGLHAGRVIYWHRDLPPISAEAMGEHILEANSTRILRSFNHRDELWERCHEDLMSQARLRLRQEVARLGGNYAHVLNEFVDSQHDEATGENWLHGRFSYMLYRQRGRK